MLPPPDDNFAAAEALNGGATPVFLASFLPYLHPSGLNNLGSFTQCAFSAPDRILFNYFGFIGGLWLSAPITSPVKRWPTAAVISWDWNSPGFDLAYFWRAAASPSLDLSHYPAAQSGASVKASSFYDSGFEPYFATDPQKSVTGAWTGNAWVSANGAPANQRLHLDLGRVQLITGIYGENGHHLGGVTTAGLKDFSLWGSNDPDAFADLTWAHDSGWTQIYAGQFAQHVALDQADPQHFYFANSAPYRYLCFKCANNWGDSAFMGVRRLVLLEAALANAVWRALNNGDTLALAPCYQFKVTADGKRCWALEDGNSPTAFTASAMEGDPDALASYAVDAHHEDEMTTYIRGLQLLGEYPVASSQVVQAGSFTLEAPSSFGELASGHQSGLQLDNRDGLWSSRRAAFIFAQELAAAAAPGDFWRQAAKQLRLDLAYLTPAGLTAAVPLFLGLVRKLGPVQSTLGTPRLAEIYVLDTIGEALKRPLALPAADGTPQPLTMGEFLVTAAAVVGTSPEPPQRTAGFAQNNFNELDHVMASGGGQVSRVAAGNGYAFRAAVTGANQTALGEIDLAQAGEIFIKGRLTFQAAPAAPANLNLAFLQLLDAGGGVLATAGLDDQSLVKLAGVVSKFNLQAYIGVEIPFACWYQAGANPGFLKLWLNGDEAISYQGNLTALPKSVRFGALTGGAAESWTIDFAQIEIRPKYYYNAFQVAGAPFAEIGPVYLDNVAQPDSQVVGGFTQTLARFPQWGLVQFNSTDPNFTPSGTLLMRVIQDAGGLHAVDALTRALAAVGLEEAINAASFAAAKAAVPGDIINCRFENPQGTADKTGAPDYQQAPLTAGDAVKDICAACLYFIYNEADGIKLFPFLGNLPGAPVFSLDDSLSSQAEQITDLDNLKYYVAVIFGWHDRDPGLACVAGQPEAGQGDQLDLTWNQPVATESRAMAQSKANLLLQFQAGQERWAPLTTSLRGARLQLFDPIQLTESNLLDAPLISRVSKKELAMDFAGNPFEHTILQLTNYLGED